MNINIRKAFALVLVMLLAVFTTSCKDDLTLSDAGDDIYITMTPRFPNLELKVGGDTVQMSCVVTNHSGDIIPAEVEWSTDKPEIAKFVEGTNKLFAVAAGKNETVMVRATLPNGRYALTRATVSSWRGEGIEFLAAPAKINEEGEGDEKTYSASFEFLKKKLYLTPDQTLPFLVQLKPSQLLKQSKIVFEGLDENLFEVKELVLDPKTEEGRKRIGVTPKGAKWFVLKVKSKVRFTDHKLTVKLDDPKMKLKQTIMLTSGTVLEELAFDNKFNQKTLTKILDINAKDKVMVFAKYAPDLPEDLENIKRDIKWEILNSNGGGCIIDKVEYDTSAKAFVAHFTAGATAGQTTLACSYQGVKIECTITIVDLANVKLDGLAVSESAKEQLSDLYVGETIPLRVKILPKSSTAFLQKELEVSVANGEFVQITENNGAFSVTGLKAGETELVFKLRDKELRVPVKTKAAVKAVNIDNTSPNIVMLGDIVEWRADVAMEGTDMPDFSKLIWSSSDKKFASIIGKTSGEVVKLKANALGEGQSKTDVSIKASYRGKENSRTLTIVPLQSDATIKAEDMNLDEAGVTEDSGKIKVLLTPKAEVNAKENLELLIEAKTGQAKIEAKTYTAADYKIYIIWSNALGVRKLAAEGSSVKFENASSGHYNLTLDLKTKVGDKMIKVKGSAQNLEKY